MGLRAPLGHTRSPTNIMSFIQSIRASHLNRHGFIDVLVGITVFQAINITLIVLFGNLDVGPDEDPSITLLEIAFLMLLVAPLVENFLLVAVAALHEKLFNRSLLFVAAPLLLTTLHFTTPQELPFPTFIRVIELFGFFYIFLKQYDLHKLEIGKCKALLLSSVLHFAVNATVISVLCLFDFYIAAETIFSAQPGD
jgi:hypothetical protein